MLTGTVGKSLMTKGYCKGLRTHSRRSERPKIMGIWRCKVSLRCGIRNNLRPLHLAASSPYSTWPNFAHPSHCRHLASNSTFAVSSVATRLRCVSFPVCLERADFPRSSRGLLPQPKQHRRNRTAPLLTKSGCCTIVYVSHVFTLRP